MIYQQMSSVNSDWQGSQSSSGTWVLLLKAKLTIATLRSLDLDLDIFVWVELSPRLTTSSCGFRWSRRSPGSSAK